MSRISQKNRPSAIFPLLETAGRRLLYIYNNFRFIYKYFNFNFFLL